MITLFNNTGKKFTSEVSEASSKFDNSRVHVSHGKTRMDVFVTNDKLSAFESLINSDQSSVMNTMDVNTCLYNANKSFEPICVFTKNTNANFLLLAQKLTKGEKVIQVVFNKTFVLAREYEKNNHFSAIVSFRTDVDSSVTIVSADKSVVYETTYEQKDGVISRSIKTFKVSEYTKYDTNKECFIKCYRPLRPTHLVFVHKTELASAKSTLTKNFTIIPVQNIRELNEHIEQYKQFGFTAASLFVDLERNAVISGASQKLLTSLKDSFKRTHLVYADGHTKNESSKPKPKKKVENKNPLAGKKPNNKVSKKKPVVAK